MNTSLKNRERYFGPVLCIVVFVISLTAAELMLRIVHPCRRMPYVSMTQGYLVEHDSLIGWVGRKNCDAELAGMDFSVNIHHNSRGHRSSTVPIKPGMINILVAGDSQAWGWGVQDNEVFTERMMQSDKDLNVYNIAVPGYGTDQEYLAVRRFLDDPENRKVDYVVIQFSANDFDDVGRVVSGQRPKPIFEFQGDSLALRNVPVPRPLRQSPPYPRHIATPWSFWNHFHLINLMEKARMNRIHKGLANRNSLEDKADSIRYKRNALVVIELFRRIKNMCAKYDIPVIALLVFPRENVQYDMLQNALHDEKISVLKCRKQGFPKRNYHCLDSHLNKHGHACLARQLIHLIRDTRTGQ